MQSSKQLESKPAIYYPPKSNKVDNKNVKKTISNTFHEFAEITSIHGISYACDVKLIWWERFLWTLVFASTITLAIYWIVEAYVAWQTFPVITSVHSTGKSISQLAYPAITICSQGWIQKVLDKAENKQFMDYVAASHPDVNITTVSLEKKVNLILQLRLDLFPGAKDPIQKIVKSMASLNPDSTLKSEVTSHIFKLVFMGQDFHIFFFRLLSIKAKTLVMIMLMDMLTMIVVLDGKA